MNNPKRLNIRIKISPQITEAVPEETGYIYHWNRIIGASLLTVTTLAVLIYNAFDYLAQPDITAQGSEITVKTDTHLPVEKRAMPIKSDIENQRNIISPTAEKTGAKQTQADSGPLISSSNNPKNVISPTAEKAVQTDSVAAPLLTQSDSKIFSKQIEPFVIAQTVKDKEPIGSINDIKLDVNNIATVYAYSKVVGLKGETLYYKWRLNGKDIAQVKVKVSSNTWRSYSRKFIQSHMLGDWSVALENAKGELLAINRFRY